MGTSGSGVEVGVGLAVGIKVAVGATVGVEVTVGMAVGELVTVAVGVTDARPEGVGSPVCPSSVAPPQAITSATRVATAPLIKKAERVCRLAPLVCPDIHSPDNSG